VLVHGLASNARLWDEVGEVLASAGHASVAIDLRGHGESDKVDHGYDFTTLVADLEAVIGATLGSPVIAAGQSWGGNVVLELAAQRPDLVTGVVCVDGGFIKLSEAFADWETAAAELAPPRLPPMPRATLEREMQQRLAGFPPGGIAAQVANFEEHDDGLLRPRLRFDRHMTILRFLWEHDPDELSGRVHQPVLVIAAEGGAPGKGPRVAGFVERLRRGSVVWMDAHHDVHAQYPEDVGRLLAAFAAEIGEGVG
jgi:pimeloyl-ACP methyl ester carboxylesterase